MSVGRTLTVMPTMDEFLKKLSADKVESVQEALGRQKNDWVEDLRGLFARIREWLGPGVLNGTLAIDDREVEIAEEDLGPYRVPAMTIRVRTGHPRKVDVEPKGMQVVGVVGIGGRRLLGALGRVDITSGPARVILLRFRDAGQTRWKLLLDDGTKEDLTSDAFAMALASIIDLE